MRGRGNQIINCFWGILWFKIIGCVSRSPLCVKKETIKVKPANSKQSGAKSLQQGGGKPKDHSITLKKLILLNKLLEN